MRMWHVAAVGAALLYAGVNAAWAGCNERLDRYQAVVGDDHRTGNVNESVYVQIERELSRATAACTAGREAEALSLIHESEVRHGYHP
ncbi:MAG: hypothetical protein WDN02_09755 [Methylovirgula sp.]|uniref:hypothetical protein n=1 Tax=Methylovirgula sp. TaxID=1978224 RepID=UPI00307650A2